MAERGIDFNSIIGSGEKSVMVLSKENHELLFVFAVLVLTGYFNSSHPCLSHHANRIADDLIETRPTWKAADFINLCKFLRQRQDIEELKVYGQMTAEKLMANVAVYEDRRAQALEQYHAKHKGQLSEENKSLDKLTPKLLEHFTSKSDEDLVKSDGGMGKEFDNIQAERERTGKNVIYKQVTPDENYFESKK